MAHAIQTQDASAAGWDARQADRVRTANPFVSAYDVQDWNLGWDEADRAMGPSGATVNIADPQALADAAVALLADGEAWQAASRAGIARVERYYTDRMMFDRYQQVYDGAFARCPGAR